MLLTGYFSTPGLRGEGTRSLQSAARDAGALTVFDTGWDPEDWTGSATSELLELLPLVDVFLPNQPEAEKLTGSPSPAVAAQALAAHCQGWVVVKNGAAGVVARGPAGETVAVPAPPVNGPLVDTTGAGDTLAAGMLASLAAGKPMAEALATGVRVASTVVGRPSPDRYPASEELLPLSDGSAARLTG